MPIGGAPAAVVAAAEAAAFSRPNILKICSFISENFAVSLAGKFEAKPIPPHLTLNQKKEKNIT